MDSKKKRKKWPWVLLVGIVIILVIFVISPLNNTSKASNVVVYDTYTATKGSITSTVTGSGQLESIDSENIDVPDGIIVSEVIVEIGDSVLAGDTLATLEVDPLKHRVAYLSSELSSLDSDLSKLSKSQTIKYVYSPVKGRIKSIPISENSDVLDNISEYGALALISLDGLMQVEIISSEELTISSEVIVKWHDGSDTGEISEKIADGYLITLDDDKAPYSENVLVYDEDTLLGEGTLDIHVPIAVYANGGTISKINYDINDEVDTTSKLFTLGIKPFSNSFQQKLKERTDIADQLETVLGYLNNPQILATNNGVISTINVIEDVKIGDATSSGESTAFVINTGGALKMEVAVDELDIHAVALDQDATVTLDAIASEKFAAKVTHISDMGNANGSITTFAINLTLSPDSRFLSGMNGNATILVDQSDDSLIIPIEAINEDSTGVFVYVGTTREKTYITTGLSDGQYAEVLSGLYEGDVVQYIGSSDESSTTPFGVPTPFDSPNISGGEATNDN